MSDNWPGEWKSATSKMAPSFTNDHGDLYMIDQPNGTKSWIVASDVPAHLRNRC